MKLYEIIDLLQAELITHSENMNIEFNYAFGCDLMSDVLALLNEDVLLLTGLANIQTIRTAEMKDIKCIVFVRNKKPDKQIEKLAEEKNIVILSTSLTLFTSCGILYENGMQGADIKR